MTMLAQEITFKTDLTIETDRGSNLITVWFRHDGKRIAIDLNAAQAIELADDLIDAVREAV